MKVIFLDFNGILDTWCEMDVINYDNLQRLKRIVNETDSKIVISSSIKTGYVNSGKMSPILEELTTSLINGGIEIVGFTPNGKTRECEIIDYLSKHPEIENYVILEDDYFMKKLSDHLVKLPCQSIGIEQQGLQDEHVDKAIKILGKVYKKEKI